MLSDLVATDATLDGELRTDALDDYPGKSTGDDHDWW
jgi:hypothetical protein